MLQQLRKISPEVMIFQLPQYKRDIAADTELVFSPGGFHYAVYALSRRCNGDIKVWLVRSQDPDVRLISKIDIVMCFIYNISAVSWRYREDVTPTSLQY